MLNTTMAAMMTQKALFHGNCMAVQGRTRSLSMGWFRLAGAAVLVAVVAASFSPPLLAADLLLVRGAHPDAAQELSIRQAATFYGLDLQTVDATPGSASQVFSLAKRPSVRGVLIEQDALSGLNRTQLLSALRNGRQAVPLLVFGLSSAQDPALLRLWSGGAVGGCTPLPGGFRPKLLTVAGPAELTRMLAGTQLPAVAAPLCNMTLAASRRPETILSVAQDSTSAVPVLVRAASDGTEIFFGPQLSTFDQSWAGDPRGLPKVFSLLAPYMIFISYAAGDYGWHPDGHYANLTIDDAWLTRSYGHLDYAALLPQMEQHNFHTTVAFVPWNFDRSEPDIVSLFTSHQDRYSVCIHGNNHSHREFNAYSKNPLADQVADIKQAVARMERFHSLTGVGYDRFMVFPQAVAPEPTFEALKKYEFLGTANYQNVPLGQPFPTDLSYWLRPYTVSYGNLASFARYPAGGPVPRQEVLIQAFLGNPVLFYGHEFLFYPGIDAFNPYADFLNQIQPDTKWTSLGEIARHSHLLRRRDDGGFDVWMFSNEMDLRNPADETLIFHIRRVDDHAAWTVDGASTSALRDGDLQTIELAIPAHQTSSVRVVYANDLDLAHQSISKTSVYAYFLRRASDFRDIYLSRSSWGHALIQAYYGHGWNGVEQRMERWWWLVLVLAGLWVVLRYRRRKARRQTPEHMTVQ